MLVWMKNKQGTWSEAVLAKCSTKVLGYARVHSVVVKSSPAVPVMGHPAYWTKCTVCPSKVTQLGQDAQ